MPDDRRDRYLAELDGLLPLPPERRAEVLEEIGAHLDDAVADGTARGLPADAVEVEALSRLGSARNLARELALPERSVRRLLAAAGAGVRTAAAEGIYGYLFGALVMYLVLWILFASSQLLSTVFGGNWIFGTTDGGWGSLLTAFALGFGLYFAGRATPAAVSLSSGRLVADVRPWMVAIVCAVVFALLVFVIEVPHNWASVIGFALAPAAFALGAYRPELLPRRIRLPLIVIVVPFVAIATLGIVLATGSGGSTSPPVVADGSFDGGLSIVGPHWAESQAFDGTMFTSTDRSYEVTGAIRYEWRLAEGASLAGLTDLRAEAWRADPARLYELHPGYTEPFAVAPIERAGDVLAASLVTTNEPGVFAWELVLTGVGPDDRRYVLDSGRGEFSTFTGSAWAWMLAVTD